MHEIVIVIADLYLPPSDSARSSSTSRSSPGGSSGALSQGAQDARPAMPGLEHATRFGQRTLVENGWREWLARWLGRDDLASQAPATVVAAATASGASTIARAGSTAVSAAADTDSSGAPSPGSAWIATPVHLIAGLTSLHLDRRGILRLPPEELQQLAESFAGAFSGSDLALTPLDSSGDFLLRTSAVQQVTTVEPSRSIVSSIAESLPVGPGASTLRRLGAEVEMWLHEHPVNFQRQRRGELPVSTLWLWGGGTTSVATAKDSLAASTLAFGSDPYLQGLWRLAGGSAQPLPQTFDDVFSYPHAQRAALVVELAQVLHTHSHWNLFDALAEIDRCFISPALQAVRRGALQRLLLLANDRQLLIRSSDRLRLWRRPRPGIEGLR